MSRGFLSKLLGAGQPVPEEVIRAQAELNTLARERPAWAGHISLLSSVLPVIYAEPPVVARADITPEQAYEKLGNGIPILRGEVVSLDNELLRRRWQDVCRTARAPKTADLDPAKLMESVLGGEPSRVVEAARACSCDSNLAATLLRLSVLPVLARLKDYASSVCGRVPWERGYCLICGSNPLLGELRGLEQLLFLRCGWCAAEWEFARLMCPFCGTRDHEALAYLTVEEEGDKQRVATCDRCHRYVKVVATLTSLAPIDLLMTDVATLHLDLAAVERGFEPA